MSAKLMIERIRRVQVLSLTVWLAQQAKLAPYSIPNVPRYDHGPPPHSTITVLHKMDIQLCATNRLPVDVFVHRKSKALDDDMAAKLEFHTWSDKTKALPYLTSVTEKNGSLVGQRNENRSGENDWN